MTDGHAIRPTDWNRVRLQACLSNRWRIPNPTAPAVTQVDPVLCSVQCAPCFWLIEWVTDPMSQCIITSFQLRRWPEMGSVISCQAYRPLNDAQSCTFMQKHDSRLTITIHDSRRLPNFLEGAKQSCGERVLERYIRVAT